jgi:hypothetical protein
MLSCGTIQFSGTCQAEIPYSIKSKFRTINNVGELTRRAKNGLNRLAEGGPTER